MASVASEKNDVKASSAAAASSSSSPHSSPHISPHLRHAHFHADHGPTAVVNDAESRFPAFGGEFQPGLYRSVKERKLANPAPLGLCAFALSTFIFGCITMKARNISQPNIIVGSAFGYGGLVQLLAGMWSMAVDNTFGATAFSSYGGFWLSVGIIYTPGGFNIMQTLQDADGGGQGMFYDSLGIMLMGWFIFTFLLLLCTLKSTVAFFSLLFFVDLALILLGCAYLNRDASDQPNYGVTMAGGFCLLMAAFLAWYNAFAGVANNSNSFVIVPVVHFPWSELGMQARQEEKERLESQSEESA